MAVQIEDKVYIYIYIYIYYKYACTIVHLIVLFCVGIFHCTKGIQRGPVLSIAEIGLTKWTSVRQRFIYFIAVFTGNSTTATKRQWIFTRARR